MHEHIMNFSNKQFYEGNLLADSSVKNSLFDADSITTLLQTPVTFIDTAGCGYTEIINPESLSISNPEEAALLIRHLKSLVTEYYLDEKNSNPISVGIISSYKEQVQYINSLINADEELENSPAKIVVITVD